MASLVLRYHEDFIQNVSTQQLAKNGLTSFHIRTRSIPFGWREKYVPIAGTVDVSVIVPTWNEEKYLPRCLLSLVDQKDAELYEIIVVDGGSADQTVEIAEKHASKVLVKPDLPVGAARNTGAEHAEGKILAFIDADTVASSHWVRQIADSFHNQAVVAVTGPTYPYEGTHLDDLVYHVATGWAQPLSLRLGFPHVAGFNCAYSKTAFWNAGGFDEGRELSEDVMLGLRIRHEGRVLFNPEMLAYTSLRRIRKFGYPYLTTYYMINAIALMLFQRNLPYPKVR
jgi:glycosyltransferase involved in cell wall biosynthesis